MFPDFFQKMYLECPAESLQRKSAPGLLPWQRTDIMLQLWYQIYRNSFRAHRLVLAASSGDYFRALLCGGLRESSEDVVCLRGVPSWVIESILCFIYTGQLRLGWTRIWDIENMLYL
uniref:BTB domain-containing protein n=1 Tax=Acanthochromis polyacanthus TaxID=80966 RepID=A0A3Q1EMA5_9TELE